MNRRSVWKYLSGLTLAAASISTASAQQATAHKVVFHVGGADPLVMRVVLINIANEADYYAERGETVAIELVANGPGYTMLRADKSPVKDEITATKAKYPFVVFSACQNSRKGAAKAEGKAPQDIPEVPEATDVPAGVVRLTELQEQHYAYIRP